MKTANNRSKMGENREARVLSRSFMEFPPQTGLVFGGFRQYVTNPAVHAADRFDLISFEIPA